MFKFLFGQKSGSAKVENQRQTVERALAEVNEIFAKMADKPVVRVDLNTGQIAVDLPDQMPDEALALPAPADVDDPVAPESETDKAA